MEAIDLHLRLRRGGTGGELDDPGIGRRPGDDSGGAGIRCPQCAWEPGRGDAWTCACLHVWNTFETAGVCPACERHWLLTQCPRCDAWSPHLAWYVDSSCRNA